MDENLIRSAGDILTISSRARKIGWNALSENTFQRIVYLLKVLYSFNHTGENIFNCYHFSTSTFGPYSELVKRGLVFLRSSEYLIEDEFGCLIKKYDDLQRIVEEPKLLWIDTILQILGKYGEEKVFSFILNDPLYEESLKSNLAREIDFSEENKTLHILNDFKFSFEETLDDTSSISKEEYISLYFDYIFSTIING